MDAPLTLHAPAPDFELEDLEAETFRLSGLRGRQHAVLVFNRGFI